MKRTRILLLITCIIIALGLQAQTTRENSYNKNAWLTYFGNHKFNKRIGLHAEVQVRRNEMLSNWQQLLLRTGLDIYAQGVRYTVGYAFVDTYPYGEFPAATMFSEHRIWQQALVDNAMGRFKLSHRYRLEQRFIDNAGAGVLNKSRYENRFRYMCRATILLQGSTLEPREFYLGLYNELFFNFGKEVAYNIFDQNRAYAALGFHLGKLGKLEVGYLYQLVQQRKLMMSTDPSRMILENNHTLQLSLINDIAFFKDNKK